LDSLGLSISDALSRVEAERQRRRLSPALGASVLTVKSYQHGRFARTYADLLVEASTGPATRFFLDELYGPKDFGARDAQFQRVAPAVVKLFPGALGAIVAELAQLHALSERLDTEMGLALGEAPLDAAAYARAWRAVGQPADRERQIQAVVDIGAGLDGQVRKLLLRSTLRLMRQPAHLAGLGDIHRFLVSGLDAFVALGGASQFLGTIAERERQLVRDLYAASAPAT
jgi:hypothetical protein